MLHLLQACWAAVVPACWCGRALRSWERILCSTVWVASSVQWWCLWDSRRESDLASRWLSSMSELKSIAWTVQYVTVYSFLPERHRVRHDPIRVLLLRRLLHLPGGQRAQEARTLKTLFCWLACMRWVPPLYFFSVYTGQFIYDCFCMWELTHNPEKAKKVLFIALATCNSDVIEVSSGGSLHAGSATDEEFGINIS